jgi:uncharacterized protein YndB with AHSA1/START domain
MPDIAMQIDLAAPPSAVYRALTTTDGIAGWWTTKNETGAAVGDLNRCWFPGGMQWDLRVTEADADSRLAWHLEGGPREGTDVRWTLSPAPDGTRILFDHTGFAAIDEAYRIVTLGWAQMLLRLKQYAETGAPNPYFDH